MSGGEAGERDTAALLEAQHVGIARDGGNCRVALADNAEIFNAGYHKPRTVKVIEPVVIIAAVAAVGRRRGEVEGLRVEVYDRIRRDGGKELIHRCGVHRGHAVGIDAAVQRNRLGSRGSGVDRLFQRHRAQCLLCQRRAGGIDSGAAALRVHGHSRGNIEFAPTGRQAHGNVICRAQVEQRTGERIIPHLRAKEDAVY